MNNKPVITSLLQATGIVGYCALTGYVLINGDKFFESPSQIVGVIMVLSILVISVLVCGLLAFGIPAQLIWEEKRVKDAIQMVLYTAGWLALYVFITMVFLATF